MTEDELEEALLGITLENVSYIYQNGTLLRLAALSDVSLTIKDGSYTALIDIQGVVNNTTITERFVSSNRWRSSCL